MSVGVSSKACPASAVATVVPSITISVLCTVAGINTLLVPAGQGIGAVVINLAFWPLALPVGVTIEAGLAGAGGKVGPCLTDGIHAAVLVDTGILALLVDAGLGVLAFRVSPAAG